MYDITVFENLITFYDRCAEVHYFVPSPADSKKSNLFLSFLVHEQWFLQIRPENSENDPVRREFGALSETEWARFERICRIDAPGISTLNSKMQKESASYFPDIPYKGSLHQVGTTTFLTQISYMQPVLKHYLLEK